MFRMDCPEDEKTCLEIMRLLKAEGIQLSRATSILEQCLIELPRLADTSSLQLPE